MPACREREANPADRGINAPELSANAAKLPLSGALHHELVVSLLRTSPVTSTTIVQSERYLRSLESASTPALPETYGLVLLTILQHRHLLPNPRERAWGLYGHVRLVAHPSASREIFDAMIYACSLEGAIAPERALDLFVEMLSLGYAPGYATYHALIRTCARARDDTFYAEALRLLRELLDRGFRPEKDIWDVLLQGAKPRGDLARAKWIVGTMLRLSREEHELSSMAMSGTGEELPASALQPDDRTISNLFLTYATYSKFPLRASAQGIGRSALKEVKTVVTEDTTEEQPVLSRPLDEQGDSDALETLSEDISDGTNVDAAGAAQQVTSIAGEEPAEASAEDAQPGNGAAEADIETAERGLELAAASRSHPDGLLLDTPLPADKAQAIEQVTDLLAAILEAHGLDSASLYESDSGLELEVRDSLRGIVRQEAAAQSLDAERERFARSRTSSPAAAISNDSKNVSRILARVPITSHLLNSYLTVLHAHAPAWRSYGFFLRAYIEYGVLPDHHTWEILFDKLNASARVRFWAVRKARLLFAEWREWAETAMREEEQRADGARGMWWNRHIATMWSRMIEMEARCVFSMHLLSLHSGQLIIRPNLDIDPRSHSIRSTDLEADSGDASATEYLVNAMELFQEFARRYPPQQLVEHARHSTEGRSDARAMSGHEGGGHAPGYLGEMSSFLYPETSDHAPPRASSSQADDADEEDGPLAAAPSGPLRRTATRPASSAGDESYPPHLTLKEVYLLFHRLREMEDRKRSQAVTRTLAKYDKALKQLQKLRAARRDGERDREKVEVRRDLVHVRGRVSAPERKPEARAIPTGRIPHDGGEQARKGALPRQVHHEHLSGIEDRDARGLGEI